ncbi:lipid kinase YegS [Pseudoalteromonas haloplanktis]|uniref:Lipid kinase YegS n=1 Tax=Pseudoalteromonas haloplanktis TaxID=228 RepID=A0ABU1B6L0_PSEHA|nr:lipid kinase YegS [Pseudoalteromonas haloplanktis]MDQ9090066.1 lipid kinase YegS [Pseudoalteromonas haloplanktis]
MSLRLILNGKKAGEESLRSAISQFRRSHPLQVRCTFEGGDINRLINEAINEQCTRLVIGGGDGTVNEAINALMKLPFEQRPELSILPLGTANDFATAAGISTVPLKALQLAQQGTAYLVDTVKVDNHAFINVASAGFGAQVTATTPVQLKNLLGGGAYTLAGLVQALSFKPYGGSVELPGVEKEQFKIIAAAVCNAKQAGGGQILAPDALIDDGLLDVVAFTEFDFSDVAQVITELTNNVKNQGRWVKRFQVPWLKWHTDESMPLNLDGEPITERLCEFIVKAKSVRLVLPEHCSLVSHNHKLI